MAYCGPTQLRSQAARPNRSNHPPLRVVILVTAVVHGKTKKKEIPRLEIAGEDGDGRSRCVFWRGAAEAAADLVKIGAVVSCVVVRVCAPSLLMSSIHRWRPPARADVV